MDDFFDSQPYLFDYSGWGIQGIYPLIRNELELALRFDSFASESGRDGNETVQNNWTGGVNYSPQPNVRLQLNYISKQTSNQFVSDLDDDILYLNFQLFFDTDISR
jgi:phosphate-selective porin